MLHVLPGGDDGPGGGLVAVPPQQLLRLGGGGGVDLDGNHTIPYQSIPYHCYIMML